MSDEPSRQQRREQEELEARRGVSEAIERRRQMRGLLWLVAVVLVASVARAGVQRVFGPGWWRLW